MDKKRIRKSEPEDKMQEDENIFYLNVALSKSEYESLQAGKERAGIRANADYIRHLIVNYSKCPDTKDMFS